MFEKADELNYSGMVYRGVEKIDGGHGRVETRKYTVMPLMYLYQFKKKWPGLQSFIQVECCREVIGGKTSNSKRYYISSLDFKDDKISLAIRGHWSIENDLHWTLDVAFKEDLSRIRKGHSAENMSVIRNIALNMLKNE